MCGRYTLRTPAHVLAEIFDLVRSFESPPRYNIAPTQTVSAIRAWDGARGGERELAPFHWGLIPSWAKDKTMAARMINARAETLAEKPSFRTAFQRRRCLIPADGFYEWKAVAPKKKQPYVIESVDGRPFAMAGLWETWKTPEGASLESLTIVTTSANETLSSLHERMPVILSADEYDVWLDPDLRDPTTLQPLLDPAPADLLRVRPVSTVVNNARHDGPDCLAAPTNP